MAKILIVDDERAIKFALQQILLGEGHEVETASSGEEGLLKAQETPFDLVITDLRMPGISGLEMIRKLKQEQPGLKTIVCSAYGSMESVVEAMRLGVNDFIVKPFNKAAMKEAVSNVLGIPVGAPGDGRKPGVKEQKPRPAPAPVVQAPFISDPGLYVPPDLAVVIAGKDGPDAAASPGEGIFWDIAEEDGQHIILFGSSPLIGPSAHALGYLVRGAFRNQLVHSIQPGEAVLGLNETLWKSLRTRPSVSLFYGKLDPKKEELCYVCAGERVMGAVRRNAGEDLILSHEGSHPLGLFPGIMVKEQLAKVGHEDRLLLVGSARLDLRGSQSGVEESLMGAVLPDANWQDSGELARQVQAGLKRLTGAQHLSDTTVIVIGFWGAGDSGRHSELRFSSAEQNLQPLLAELGRLGQKAGISTDVMHDITTAIVEAVNNAQTHAYPEKGDITVRMTISNGELVIEVVDEGVGFDLREYRPPDLERYDGLTTEHGRGIYLIQRLMDRTLIESRPGQGTIVHMAKSLEPQKI